MSVALGSSLVFVRLFRLSIFVFYWFSLDYLWPPYVIGQAIIFLPCGFFFYLSVFFSSPNLSRRRLDVCYRPTATHGVALVRIKDAGLKLAARRSLKIQDAKSRQKSLSGQHRTTLSAISSQLRHVSTIGKNMLISNMFSRCPPQYGELWPTTGWDRFTSSGHPS